MTVNNTTTTNQTPAASTSTAAAAKATLGSNYQTFLTLLTTQLKNQDPLSPTDSAQFTNQLVLFSQVEQQISQNDKLEQLLKLQTTNQTQAAIGYIGMNVEVSGSKFELGTTPVNLTYSLPQAAKSAQIRITDSTGKLVRTGDTPAAEGSQTVSWDGNDSSGKALPAGTYNYEVVATSDTGATITVDTHVNGTVTGVETQNGVPMLKIGDLSYSVDSVVSAQKAN
jgi:flagellar basal-body rod modification protein FlgD